MVFTYKPTLNAVELKPCFAIVFSRALVISVTSTKASSHT